MYLYGKNSVTERLKTNPQTIRAVFLESDFDDSVVENLIKLNRIACKRLAKEKLLRLKWASNTQGIIAEIESFRYKSYEELLGQSISFKATPIFLDRVYDPQNLGSIIRTAACFGNFSVVIPKHKACEVNETVLHIAQGAENYIKIALVSNISNAMISAKRKGLWIMGAVLGKDAQNLSDIDIPFPLGLVLGSEGEGVRYGIDKHLDIKAQIQMKGAALSYNVAMACAIFCYEVNKQRK